MRCAVEWAGPHGSACLPFLGEKYREMEKKKDVKRIYTGIALVLWVVVSLIGTFFYKEFGGALGDSRIFLWLYAPVLLLAMRLGEFRPGKPIGRWGQVFATFAIGAAIYIGLLLGYNPLCDAWVWVIIIILLFAFVVKILGLESMLHPHKGCLASYVIILLYSSYLIALVGLSVVLHPLSVHQIRVVGEAEGYQYIGWVDSNRDICPLGTYLFTDAHGDTYYYYDVISGKIADHRNIGQLLNSINVEKG